MEEVNLAEPELHHKDTMVDQAHLLVIIPEVGEVALVLLVETVYQTHAVS